MVVILKRFSLVFGLVLALLFTSCGGQFQRLQKSGDTKAKYDAALQYYKDKDYLKALQLFEQLLIVYRGTEKAEDINYYYAYCNYYVGDYVMAQYYFTNYYHTYAHTPRAEECEYMRAFCEYLLSPIYSLDQTDTQKAIEAFQTFVDDYPNSERVKECNKDIDILRAKLERKYFEIAKQYYTIASYHAASAALNNYVKDYPTSKYLEDAYFLMLQADYKYAVNSITRQKAGRLAQVVKDYHKFVDNYPKSDYLKQAEELYNNTVELQKNPTKS